MDTKSFEINGKSYTAKFPNNREYLQIQNNKVAYASHYPEFQFMGAEEQYAALLIEAFSHLQVLSPDFVKDLNKPLLELGLKEGREISKAYTDQIRPWYNENLNFIFGVNKEDDGSATASTEPTTTV